MYRAGILIVSVLLVAWGQLPLAYAAQHSEPQQHVHGGRYLGLKTARVDVKTADQLDALRRLGVTILDDYPGTRPLKVVATGRQLDELRRMGLTVRVARDDVQALVDAERLRSEQQRLDPFADFFLDYHAYDSGAVNIVWYMNELATRYPTLASVVLVGTTLEGRTIWGLRVSNDAVASKPAVIYFGCEHAREWITTTVPTYLATYLLQNYGSDPVATDLVDNVEFFLIPVFNIDGYEYTWTTYRLWRKNRRNNGGGVYGVDLNRNWAEGWGGPGSDGVPSSEIYRGTAPFSEPETQELRDFFIAHPNVRAQLDIHSYSQLILWPYGYTATLPPDQNVYQQVGSAMQSLIYGVHGMSYSIGPIYTAIYPASGGSLDWTYAQLGVLSYSFECRDTGAYGFELPADQIIPNNEELLPAILHLTDSDWVRAAIRIEFPGGVPGTIITGSDTTVAVNLVAQSESVVPGSPRLHYRYDPAGAYTQAPLTPLGGDAYEAVLPATNCWSTPEFYFSAQGDGGTTETSPRQAPTAGTYTANVASASATFFQETLDSDPGWQTEGQWAWGQPTGGGGQYGGPDPTSGYTGNNVYGYNLNGDYPNYLAETHLTSPAIDCTGRSGVRLSFWRWLGVEQPSYDHAYVRVSNNGVDWVTVWQNGAEVTDTAWTYQELDISAVADNQAAVYLRWTMGSSDVGWRYCGWNIDDVRLISATCDGVRGDYDGNSVIDLNDHAAFSLCLSGPEGGIAPGCVVFDFLPDADVDLDDGASFQNAFNVP